MAIQTSSDTFFQNAVGWAGNPFTSWTEPGSPEVETVVRDFITLFQGWQLPTVPTTIKTYLVSKSVVAKTFPSYCVSNVFPTTGLEVFALGDVTGSFVADVIKESEISTNESFFKIQAYSDVIASGSHVLDLISNLVDTNIATVFGSAQVSIDYNVVSMPVGFSAVVPHVDKSWYFPHVDSHANYTIHYDGGVSGDAIQYVQRSTPVMIIPGYQDIQTTLIENVVSKYKEAPFVANLYDPVNFAVQTGQPATIELKDYNPPVLENLSPGSGISFVDHETNVSLDVKDYASAINLTGVGGGESALNIYVNDDHIIQNGVVNIAYSGTVTLTSIAAGDRAYRVAYDPAVDFTFGEFVTVSGSAEDTAEPDRNLGLFSYSFKVWGLNNITASATATPDIIAPVITNLFPAVASTNISSGADIHFTISDAETGVNLNTLLLAVAGESVITNGIDTSTSGTVSITGDRFSYDIQYIPDNVFGYSSVISVVISGSDAHDPLNSINLDYNFQIVSEDLIQISNIFIDVGDSLTATGTTTVTAYVTDMTYGIYSEETYFIMNGDEVTTTLTPLVSGSVTYGYELSYELGAPYYDGILCFEVHAQNRYPHLLEW